MTAKPVPLVTALNRDYWEGTALGELRFQSCRVCAAAFRFNTIWCPLCGSQDVDWEASGGEGSVVAFSIIAQAPYDAFADRVPYVLSLVELAEGFTVMANIVECAPDAVAIGAPVSLIFEQRGEFHLPQFRLAGP